MYEGGGDVFEGTGQSELTDIICTMYPNVDKTIALTTKNVDRPVILCEYRYVTDKLKKYCLSWSTTKKFPSYQCHGIRPKTMMIEKHSHAMGNSNGNIHLYWEVFWDNCNLPRLQGGFIWDMVDQGLRKRDEVGFCRILC